MSFGLAVFAAIKLVQGLDDRWSRAKPGFRRSHQVSELGDIWILAYRASQLTKSASTQLQREVEGLVGLQCVVRLDDLFGGESFIKSNCADFQCLMVLVRAGQHDELQKILSHDRYALCRSREFHLKTPWNLESKTLAAEVTPWVLEMAAEILHEA
jgi:hypothetical protein